ncbi:hypothetical protein [Terriglobus roseus]|uniref:Zinc-finger n=1 Tax=Terriglobus roseus TaxID=392734 RepID=A0A1H4K2I4_9BACT|nr:hypothetical protein [Terriglobus roseus]SEB52315.1 hypothetical protein SAMN05443244_0949 [Terriglobus roseus]
MNPQKHEEYILLCSLYSTGDLTEEEWAHLQVHLAFCEECRIVFDQYEHLTSEVMPALGAAAYLESKPEPMSFSLEAAEARLFKHLESEAAEEPPRQQPKTSWRPYVGLAACLVGVGCFVGFRLGNTKPMAVSVTTPATRAPAPSGAAVQPAGSPNGEASLKVDLVAAKREIARLQDQLSAAEARSRESISTSSTAKEQVEAEQTQLAKMTAERDTVIQQLAEVRADSQSLQERAAASSTAATREAGRASSLETELKELTAAVEEKDRLLSLDREFLSHDREIRDLIAARDLYIADIYDVAQNGKTAKPFGRIFYTKDRSLVFYGYDLDKQAGLKQQAVAFQAWGSGDDKQNVSLGLFYQDETKKRWVLQFKDTKTLARLNMVFVTAEPQGGSAKPTGKLLLLAYLQVQANHP